VRKENRISLTCALACVNLLAASCAPNCPPPKTVTLVVKEPVAVACIDPASIPPEPGTITLPIDARLAADLAASQAKDLRVWGRKLLALATPCATGAPK
jgi:hypothetical protein